MRFATALLPLLAAFAQPALANSADDFEAAIAAIEARVASAERGGELTRARRDPAVAAQFSAVRAAMEQYGSDRPDLRYDLRIFDATDAFRGADFGVTRSAIESGGRVRAGQAEVLSQRLAAIERRVREQWPCLLCLQSC